MSTAKRQNIAGSKKFFTRYLANPLGGVGAPRMIDIGKK